MPKKSGFTLIELLVVISIIAILSVIGIVSYTQITKSSKDAKRITDLKTIQSALEQYNGDQRYYPYSESLVTPFTNATGAPGSQAETKIYLNNLPSDPNGSSYLYKAYKADLSECLSSDAGKCTKYCLYANLEVSTPNLAAECSARSGYNYAVTSP